MNINGIPCAQMFSHAGANTAKNETISGFDGALHKAAESKPAANTPSLWDGDMTISHSQKAFGPSPSASNSEKPTEEMTMEEYKQWVMGEISKMPMSSWVQTTFSSGTLIIKEEAFAAMKNDPSYEAYVLNRVRSYYSANGLPVGSNNMCYEVIGASKEECYGYAGPVGGGGFEKEDTESWWERLHEQRERLEEQRYQQMLLRYPDSMLRHGLTGISGIQSGLSMQPKAAYAIAAYAASLTNYDF